MKQNKDNLIKLRCTTAEKKRLASMAEATGQSESEVVRQLLNLGYDQIMTALLAMITEGKTGKVKPTLTFADDDPKKFARSILVIGSLLSERGRFDAFEPILEALFDPETKADTLARVKRAFAYDLAADEGVNYGT